jgi:hypothetical protein
VQFTNFSATDNVRVTGYMVTESSTTPAAADAGWSSDPTASYTFASAGNKTLYAWAKDAAGNVSLSKSDAVTIDLTPPVIKTFTVPVPTAPIKSKVSDITLATDSSSGATDYLITESESTPTLNDASWTKLIPPTSYILSSAKPKILYAWAKDAAGNISQSLAAQIPYCLEEARDALNFIVGIKKPTQTEIDRFDVAPIEMTKHLPKPDGIINLDDVLVMIRSAVGLQW